MGPNNSLLSNARSSSRIKKHKRPGMEPGNWLPLRRSPIKLVKETTASGMAPRNLFQPKSSTFRLAKRVAATGMAPLALFMNWRPTPTKPSTQTETQFAQTILEQFVQTVPPFPLQKKQKQAERFSANYLCKLYFLRLRGWFLGGLPSLDLFCFRLRRANFFKEATALGMKPLNL